MRSPSAKACGPASVSSTWSGPSSPAARRTARAAAFNARTSTRSCARISWLCSGCRSRRRLPGGDHPGTRLFARRMPLHQAGHLVAVQRRIGARRRQLLVAMRCQSTRCRRGSVMAITPTRSAMARNAAPASIACSCSASPTSTSLAPAACARVDQPAELARADHAGLVHHQHVLGGQRLLALLPGILPAGDRPAFDAGAALEALGRNTGERRASNPVALPLPDLAGSAEHRALPAAGDADHHGEVARARHMQIGQLCSSPSCLCLPSMTPAAPLVVHPMPGAPVERGRRRDQPPLDRRPFPASRTAPGRARPCRRAPARATPRPSP